MREMPTGAKLVGALSFAALGFGTAVLFLPHIPEGQRGQFFAPSCAALGLVMGWTVMGRLVGGDYKAAARAGITTSLWLFVWSILVFSLRLMLMRSYGQWYKTPIEALTGLYGIGLDYAALAMRIEVLGPLVVGGMLAGALTEFSSRRWS